MTLCQTCNNLTTNPKYCNRTCAARTTNKIYIKRKRTINYFNCKICNKPLSRGAKNKCRNCISSLDGKTIKDFKIFITKKGFHPSQTYSHIRVLCRRVFKHLQNTPCKNCGYSKHVELCHSKPISSFPDSALINEVNNIDNIVVLCRNCHWEFDHNLLKI